MNSEINTIPHSSVEMENLHNWRSIVASEWKLLLIGAIVTFFLASVFMSGLHDGLVPDLSRPYGYKGDGMFHAWMAQRVTEGWLFENVRSGYPFGSNFLDFPGSDAGDHLLIKFLSLVGGGWPAGVKLFFLLGFVASYVATYVTARAFGLNRAFALTMSMLYTFAPFHFLRLQHLFYTWYFVAPLFFYLALHIFLARAPANSSRGKVDVRKLLVTTGGMLILASFGVYYALFGIIILATAGLASALVSRELYGFKKAVLLIGATIFGVFINIAPNLLGTYVDGPNPEVAQRSTGESEMYGLKMMQLLMPRADHRISSIGQVAQRYNLQTPLINENSTSTLGVIGAAGFMMALLYLIFIPARLESDSRLRLLAVVTFVLFLFATVGGLGSLFAISISPSIRGWNRDSIFIACGALLFLFIALQILLQKKARYGKYSVAIAMMFLFVGLYDQTAPTCKDCSTIVKASFDSDRDFVHAIEKALPPGGSVYQLPYIGFPEVPVLNRLQNYQMMAGVLHSKSLHWSFGGMKGRPGDLFYRSLAQEPLVKQIEVVRKLGFNGIYIDRRGYADNGEALIRDISQLLGEPPLLQSNDKEVVFFKLEGVAPAALENLSPGQIKKKAGYYADALGPRHPGNLAEGIDFTKSGLPDFISTVKGLYDVETWGRWSGKKAVFTFTDPLPQKFVLVLRAQGFAGNGKEPTRVKIGNRKYTIQVGETIADVYLKVDLDGRRVDSITFIPPKPASPSQTTGSVDNRIIGIGFASLKILNEGS